MATAAGGVSNSPLLAVRIQGESFINVTGKGICKLNNATDRSPDGKPIIYSVELDLSQLTPEERARGNIQVKGLSEYYSFKEFTLNFFNEMRKSALGDNALLQDGVSRLNKSKASANALDAQLKAHVITQYEKEYLGQYDNVMKIKETLKQRFEKMGTKKSAPLDFFEPKIFEALYQGRIPSERTIKFKVPANAKKEGVDEKEESGSLDESDIEVIAAHDLVVNANSKKFSELKKSGFKGAKDNQFFLPTSKKVAEKFVEFLYTQKITDHTEADDFELFGLAEMYEIEALSGLTISGFQRVLAKKIDDHIAEIPSVAQVRQQLDGAPDTSLQTYRAIYLQNVQKIDDFYKKHLEEHVNKFIYIKV